MKNRRIFTVFGVVAVAAVVLSACRAEEQGRIIQFKPGVYLGKKDTGLNSDQQAVLRERSNGQSDRSYISFGGGERKTKSDVNIGTLKDRIDGQRVK